MGFYLTNKEALTVSCSVVKYAVRGRREHRLRAAGGARGAAPLPPPPPPQILGNSDFGAARENLAKPVFKDVSMFFY